MATTVVTDAVKTVLTAQGIMRALSVLVLIHLIIPLLDCVLVIGISIGTTTRTDVMDVVVAMAVEPVVILMVVVLVAKLTGTCQAAIVTVGLQATNRVVSVILAMKIVGVVVVVLVIVVEVHLRFIIQVVIAVIVRIINTEQARCTATRARLIPIHAMITQLMPKPATLLSP